MTERLLVFDFFGVICSEIAPFWLAKYFSTGDATRIKREIVTQADTGTISQQELFEQLGKLAGIGPTRVHEEWWSYVSIDGAVLELIQDLRATHRIALLTNSPAPFVREILSKHQLSPYFERILVSSEEGLAKPGAEIYLRMIEALGTQPQNVVMIDDNPANISGAEAVGMQTILFRSAALLRDQLVQKT